MNVLSAPTLAREAKAASPSRPATAIVHDGADARVVLFRIEPGQHVAVHQSKSSVTLLVLAGNGIVAGAEGEREVRAGDIVAYAPDEPHGMRALDTQFLLAAVMAPRPGARER